MKPKTKPQKNFSEVILAAKFGWIMEFLIILCTLGSLYLSDKPISESAKTMSVVMPFVMALGIMLLERTISEVDIRRDVELKTDIANLRDKAIKTTQLLFSNLGTWIAFFISCLVGAAGILMTNDIAYPLIGLILLAVCKFVISWRVYYFTNVCTGLEQFQEA